MSKIKRPWILGGVLAILLLSLVMAVVACGGSSTTTTAAATSSTEASSSTGAGSSTTATLTGDAALIAANWMKFFDGSQAATDKAALLENGQQYAQQIQAYAATPLAKMAKAEVSAVKMTSANTADVTYSLIVGGTPVLTNQQGKAVLQNGTWKVGAQTFQGLLAAAQQQGSSTTAPGGATPSS